MSPTADSDLAQLESEVILGTVAANLLPESEKVLPSQEAGKMIEEMKEDDLGMKRWDRLGWVITLVGAIIWFEVEVARAAILGGWMGILFPVSIECYWLVGVAKDW